MLAKVGDILTNIGTDKSKILNTTIYLKGMSMFARMNEIWDNWVAHNFALARSCVEAKMSRDAILVEISVITTL